MRSINKWLRSEETGLPFSHCVRCRIPLLEINTPWLVNKDYHRRECVTEYAICQDCRDAVADQLSENSKEAVRNFLEKNIDWQARVGEFMNSPNPCDRFSACIACRTSREQLEGYAVSAYFDSGGDLVSGPLPLLICRPCIDRMAEVLSETSRKVWRDFIDSHFDGPVGDAALPGLF